MVFETEHGVFRVFFQYDQYEKRRRVTCFLKRLEDKHRPYRVSEVIYRESVTCDSRDRFSKVFGRKEALRKVLSWAGFFDKATRSKVWEQYKLTHRYICGK